MHREVIDRGVQGYLAGGHDAFPEMPNLIVAATADCLKDHPPFEVYFQHAPFTVNRITSSFYIKWQVQEVRNGKVEFVPFEIHSGLFDSPEVMSLKKMSAEATTI